MAKKRKRTTKRKKRGGAKRGKKPSWTFLQLLLFPAQAILLLVLPFFLLIRVSLFLHLVVGIGPWWALAAGIALTFVLVGFYLHWLVRKLSAKRKLQPSAKRRSWWVAGILTGLFCIYTLFLLSEGNAKTKDIHGQYTSVHPILRLAIGGTTLFDRATVITDLSRVSEDYEGMGLATKGRSLHYQQSDGYVHAADLRTIGRSEWRNRTVEALLRLLGFNTLRHTGSADHLHVSLPTLERPGEL